MCSVGAGCRSYNPLRLDALLTIGSDGDTPEKQAAQIMAIYPILEGQKWDPKNVIPPRASISGSETPNTASRSAEVGLINAGQNNVPSSSREVQKVNAPIDPSHGSTAEIQEMLAATGSRATNEPLIDFHEDLDKSFPAGVKGVETENSSDEFVDAQG